MPAPDDRSADQARAGQRSRQPSPASASACPAASSSAAPAAASPAAPARPTRPPCTAPASSGPAPSKARPSPASSPRSSTTPTRPGSPAPAGSASWPPSWKRCPWPRWPGPKAGPRSPRAPRPHHGPGPSGARISPRHPKRREIHSLNAGLAPRKHHVIAGQQSCVDYPLPDSRYLARSAAVNSGSPRIARVGCAGRLRSLGGIWEIIFPLPPGVARFRRVTSAVSSSLSNGTGECGLTAARARTESSQRTWRACLRSSRIRSEA